MKTSNERKEWSYFDRVDADRQKMLLAVPDFETIIQRILAEMEITYFDVWPGERGNVEGCKRPEFALRVEKETFDQFHNSPQGYRGQFHKHPEVGDQANAQLLSLLSNKLVEFAQGKPTKAPITTEEIRRSLAEKSAKIWINETGRASTGTTLQADLLVQPWLRAAKDFLAHGEPPEAKHAPLGVKAPRGTVLDVKGAFLNEHGKEKVAENKKDRSRQIHRYGYT